MLPNLNEMQSYCNKHVLARYKKDYPDSSVSAEAIFAELMKYFWLICKHAQDKSEEPENVALDFKCIMHEEMIEIDNMWHTFLLFTKDYHDFCKKYVRGYFIHHYPLTENEKVISSEIYETELSRYLNYIYDNLGEETLLSWFKC